MIEASWRGARVLVLAPTPTFPLDYGNRRRIHSVCAELKHRGAEVHYVHYAAEADWRGRIPFPATKEMAAQWDSCWTVAPTRPLHADSLGYHHELDEWWDDNIGEMLQWLFESVGFDVLLVNYAWLSKAFQFASAGVLKVLDTHDRFSGRRELFEANGLAPEFFYLSEAAEREALERADVIWAIKQEEADFFATLTQRPIFVMPHAEPIQAVAPRSERENAIRFGIVGARNTINLTNTLAFLRAAEAYVERTLLPCEFHVAGSCCDDLVRERLPPFVRLHGRMDDLVDFYRAVDVVLAPMTFSTGLKIKVGEALHLGKALIAHAHAYEGYPPQHHFHTLASFDEMLRACRQVVRAPSLVGELEAASLAAAAESARMVARGFDATAAALRNLPRGMIVALALEDVASGNLRFDHACEVAQYLGWIGPAHILLHGAAAAPMPDEDALYRLAGHGSIAVTPGLAERAGELGRALRRVSLRVRSWPDLAEEGHPVVWFASPLGAAEKLPTWPGVSAYVHAAALGSALDDSAAMKVLRRLARHCEAVTLMQGADGPFAATARTLPNLRTLRVPLFYNGHKAFSCWMLGQDAGTDVVLLADALDDPLLALTRSLVETPGQPNPLLVLPPNADASAGTASTHLVLQARNARAAPRLVLDLAVSPAHDALREAMDRSGVARLTLFRPTTAGATPPEIPSLGADGLVSSVELTLAALATPEPYREAAQRRSGSWTTQADPGWAVIWAECKGALHGRQNANSA